MNIKLKLLQEYIKVQAKDEALWQTDIRTPVEAYLQQEIRHLAFLIEDATPEEIKISIENYQGMI